MFEGVYDKGSMHVGSELCSCGSEVLTLVSVTLCLCICDFESGGKSVCDVCALSMEVCIWDGTQLCLEHGVAYEVGILVQVCVSMNV